MHYNVHFERYICTYTSAIMNAITCFRGMDIKDNLLSMLIISTQVVVIPWP